MAGDEVPKGQGGTSKPSNVTPMKWILVLYTIWTVIYAVNMRQDLMFIGTGVGLVGLAVIVTRPPDQRR